ncbi:MAG TPA: nitroreductase family protein [Candidatus Lokiarchaeia archaeon]|nr:nitroreductase family protein [Candidatus Lokiarchaeia archaeon]
MESKTEIDLAKCSRCGKCIDVCGSKIIGMEEAGPRVMHAESCIECGKCVAVCPADAIHMKDIDNAGFHELEAHGITLEQFYNLACQRRSVRHYQPDAVRREDVERMMRVVQQAPTGGNFQELEYTVISDPVVLDGIRALLLDKFLFLGKLTPLLRLVQSKENVQKAKFTAKNIARIHAEGGDHLLRNAPTMVIIHSGEKRPLCDTDAAIAGTYLNLAAELIGVGVQWLGYYMVLARVFKQLRKRAGIPPDHRVLAALLMGYKQFDYPRACARKPLKIHYISG